MDISRPLRRGDIVLANLQGDYGKPRPVVIIQNDLLNATHASIVVLPITSTLTSSPLIRLRITPSGANGLAVESEVMVDKITAVPMTKIKRRTGTLEDTHLEEVERMLVSILDIAHAH